MGTKKGAPQGSLSVLEIAFQIHAGTDEGIEQLVVAELIPLIFSGAVTQCLQGSAQCGIRVICSQSFTLPDPVRVATVAPAAASPCGRST